MAGEFPEILRDARRVGSAMLVETLHLLAMPKHNSIRRVRNSVPFVPRLRRASVLRAPEAFDPVRAQSLGHRVGGYRIQAEHGALIQRNKGPVETKGGTWEALEYEAKMGKKDPSARGAHILLEFRPGKEVNATKIGLVQTVLVLKNGDFYYLDDTVKARSFAGASIDQTAASQNPLYAVEEDEPGETLGEGAVQPGAGRHGYRFPAKDDVAIRSARLQDNPHIRGVESLSKQVFETTALGPRRSGCRDLLRLRAMGLGLERRRRGCLALSPGSPVAG